MRSISSCKLNSKTEKMDNIELSNGIFIKCKSLSFNEFETLKLTVSGGPIEKFRKQFGVEVYQLNNQDVIANEVDYYMLFDNVDDVERVLVDNQTSHGTEILSNKNPFGKDFPNHTHSLIKELTDALSVKYVQSDEQLLKDLDYKLDGLPNISEFKKKHLLNFIAVIGEVLLKENKSEWEMILSSDGKTWNPYLRSTGRPIEFFTYLYEDIYTNGNLKSSLFEVYQTVVEIEKNRR